MKQYMIVEKRITTVGQIYLVEARTEAEALRDVATGEWDKVECRTIEAANKVELVVEEVRPGSKGPQGAIGLRGQADYREMK